MTIGSDVDAKLAKVPFWFVAVAGELVPTLLGIELEAELEELIAS